MILEYFAYIAKHIKKNNIVSFLLSFLKNKFNNNYNITNGYNCIYGSIKPKIAFTILELSIVIVIISVVLSVILFSKSLINASKVGKIYEEYRMYNNAIQLFFNQYECMPGDCNVTQLNNINPQILSNCAQVSQLSISSTLAGQGSVGTNTFNVSFPQSYATGITPPININSFSNGYDSFAYTIQNITNSGFQMSVTRTGAGAGNGWGAAININYDAIFSSNAIISPSCCKVVSSATAIANTTNTEIYNIVNTGSIESSTKRSCLFEELQIAGFISGKVNVGYSDLTDSIAGKTIPISVYKGAAWDFRRVNNTGTSVLVAEPNTGRFSSPFEIGLNPMTNWAGNSMLIIRDANGATGLNYDVSLSSGQTTAGADYGISANMAQKIDSKFDDGNPYGGSIIGGLNASQYAATSNTTCNTFVGQSSLVSSAFSGVNYLSSNNVSKGCLVAFLMPSLG